MNPWIKLWELANDDTVAHVEIERDSADAAILVYSDGSKSRFFWHAGEWQYDSGDDDSDDDSDRFQESRASRADLSGCE